MPRRRSQQPAHRFLRFIIEHTGGLEDFHYIDLAKELSNINRKLYRQGRTYHVANITVHDTSEDNMFIKFCTLPNNYVTRNAWRLAFSRWKKMNREYVENMGSKGKWLDFKVYMNNDHRTDIDKPLAVDTENNTYSLTGMEWVISKFFSPDGTTSADEFTVHMMGDHNGSPGAFVSVSAIAAWDEFRKFRASDPVMSSEYVDSVWVNLFDDGTQADEIAEAFTEDGDQPPYSPYHPPGLEESGQEYMSDPWVVRETNCNEYNPIAMVPGFPVPLGLLCIETNSPAQENKIEILIELAPGKYSGVLSENYAR